MISGLIIAIQDTWPPRIGDLIFIADKAYTREEIIGMELLVLEKLDHNFGCPMPLNFLRVSPGIL